MESKYGQISENTKINKTIYICFDYLNEKDQKKFVKKFKTTPHNRIDIMHIFSELILGAYLSANGMKVESERTVGGKNPDWSILDDSLNIVSIVEVVNHHLDSDTISDNLKKLNAGEKAIGYFPHRNDPDFLRLYKKIEDKAGRYKTLIAKLNVPYVVAVFMDFTVVVDVQETIDCLTGGDESLFKCYPDLSGVIHFEESNRGTYGFSYIENPYALRKVDIPSAYFTLI